MTSSLHNVITIECPGTRRQAIEAGDAFLLFPGKWHRYRPAPSTGWDEHWIGFNGSYADQIMSRFFKQKTGMTPSAYRNRR